MFEVPDELEPVPVGTAYADADGEIPAADEMVMVGYDEGSADADVADVDMVTKLEATGVMLA